MEEMQGENRDKESHGKRESSWAMKKDSGTKRSGHQAQFVRAPAKGKHATFRAQRPLVFPCDGLDSDC